MSDPEEISVGQRAEGRRQKNERRLPSALCPLPYSRNVVLACITTATFTDLVAYSVAVPILPDYATRFNASPTMIGLLFASFGLTLLVLSIPMGALSDRLGRKGPMIFGLALLAGATLAFAYATSLPMLFVARLLQGAADGMTWIVGFALIADLYGPAERGRAKSVLSTSRVRPLTTRSSSTSSGCARIAIRQCPRSTRGASAQSPAIRARA